MLKNQFKFYFKFISTIDINLFFVAFFYFYYLLFNSTRYNNKNHYKYNRQLVCHNIVYLFSIKITLKLHIVILVVVLYLEKYKKEKNKQ